MKILNMITFVIACDSARPWQYGFQDPATPIISGIINLHNNIIFYLIIIACLVCWLLFRAIFLFNENKNARSYKDFTHSTSLEIGWTLAPAVLLLMLAGPSFALLYAIDEAPETKITLKVIGHQWYWSYEYNDAVSSEKNSIIFDSYIITNLDDLVPGNLRLLEVDNQVVLPTKTHIRVCISSSDVLHSWAVPALGVKIDACPGRLNMVSMYIDRAGLFYGQCSEICGVNHGFMPIVVRSMSPESYLGWLACQLDCIENAATTDSVLSVQAKSSWGWKHLLAVLAGVALVGGTIYYLVNRGCVPASAGSGSGTGNLPTESLADTAASGTWETYTYSVPYPGIRSEPIIRHGRAFSGDLAAEAAGAVAGNPRTLGRGVIRSWQVDQAFAAGQITREEAAAIYPDLSYMIETDSNGLRIGYGQWYESLHCLLYGPT